MNAEPILREYIASEIMRGRQSQLGATDDLLSTGILDSLGILQVVAFIEERFNVRVADEDVVYENFYSIGAMTNYLNTLQPAAAG